jgi:SPP1 gp7 family putative phage head morphogenesis protein
VIDFHGDPRGWELRLLIERLKFERWLSSEIDDLLERNFNRVVDEIVSSRYRTLTQFQQQRLSQLFQTLGKRLAEAYAEAAKLQLEQMRGYAVLESDVVREAIRVLHETPGTFNVSIGAGLSKAYIASIAKLPIQGLNIGEWFDAQARTMALETRRIIQQGLVDGIGPYAIASKIVNTKPDEPALVKRARNDARVISRTAVNAVQNDAQMATLSALPDRISDSYVYEAVLDSRTTAICRALSGRVFRYDDPRRKVPPQHVGCRSTVRALLKGIKEPMADQKTPRTLKNYDTYLRTRSVTEQNDILGPSRASLWRSGTMKLEDAISADNRVLTLKQLRERILQGETVGAT